MDKVAILIDGAYLLKRLPKVRPDVDITNATDVAKSIQQLVHGHLSHLGKDYGVENIFQLLYRTFYYDAVPYKRKTQQPISQEAIDYALSEQTIFREALFKELRKSRNFAVRLGEVRGSGWTLKTEKVNRLIDSLREKIDLPKFTDSDFQPTIRQKGVDMRIGIDIVSITLKRQANIIVLVTGDADFVPAAKQARREGMRFILDPLRQNVSSELSEHIDQMQFGFVHPSKTVKQKKRK